MGSGNSILRAFASPMKSNDPHPLQGRCGEGPPIAPPGWYWRAGTRCHDMYFDSPDGNRFRSKVQLQQYLRAHPESGTMEQFRWNFSPNDFRGEALPGNPGSWGKKRRPSTPNNANMVSESSVRKRLRLTETTPARSEAAASGSTPVAALGSVEESEQDDNSVDTEMGTEKKQDENPVDTEMGTEKEPVERQREPWKPPEKSKLVLGMLAGEVDVPTVSMEGLSDVDTIDLRDGIEELGLEKLSSFSEPALRWFYKFLRNEDAPSSLGIGELSELCSSFLCKRKQVRCPEEVKRIRAMVDKVEPDLASAKCARKSCCDDSEFCPGCLCNTCRKSVIGNEKWEFFSCKRCLHHCHLHCSLTSLQMLGEMLCVSCYDKPEGDLVRFCLDRVEDARLASGAREMDGNISAVVKVVGSIARCAGYLDVKKQFQTLLSGASFQDAAKKLTEMQGEFGLPAAIHEELVLGLRMAIMMQEQRDKRINTQHERDFADMTRLKQEAESLRRIVDQLTSKLSRLEESAKAKEECAERSMTAARASKKKLGELKKDALAEGMAEIEGPKTSARVSDTVDLLNPAGDPQAEPLIDRIARFIRLHQQLNGGGENGFVGSF